MNVWGEGLGLWGEAQSEVAKGCCSQGDSIWEGFVLQTWANVSSASVGCHMGSRNVAQQHPSSRDLERREQSVFLLLRHSCGPGLPDGWLGTRRPL